MERVAVYARVSTASQEERHTIEDQLVACREYAEHQGYEVIGEFKDDGVSGAVPFDERPEGARLLEMAQEGLFDRVVIYTVDRLGRDTSEGIIAVRRLRKAKVVPEFVSQSFDDTPEGRFTFQVFLAVAELERGLIARRTTQGRRRQVRAGGFMGSITPYGYCYEPVRREGQRRVGGGVLSVHPVHAAVVRDIFRWSIDEGIGAPKIAKRLNERKVAPPDNAQHPRHRSTHGWHQSTVNRILTDRRYVGEGDYAGEKMHYPPLVDEATFEAAREAMERRKRFRASHPKRVFLLQHIVRCHHCGAACSASTLGRQKLPYYVCTKARRYGAEEHGSKSQWPASKVEPAVQRWVAAFIDDPETALAQADLYIKRLDEQHTERIHQRQLLSERLKALDNEEERAATSHVKGFLDQGTLEKQFIRIRRERIEAQAKLDKLEKEDESRAKVIVNRQMVLAAIELMRNRRPEDLAALELMTDLSMQLSPPDEWQDTIRKLVRTVWLEPDGSVSVEGSLPAAASDAISPRS